MATTGGGSEQEFTGRLDTLLSSAIREKARDERVLADALNGVHEDLRRFEAELNIIRRLTQRPYQPVLALLGSKLDELGTLVGEIKEQLDDRVEAAADFLSTKVTEEAAGARKVSEDWGRFLDARLSQETAGARKYAKELSDFVIVALREDSQRAAADVRHLKQEIHDHLTSTEEGLRGDLEVAQEAVLEQVGDSAEAATERLSDESTSIRRQIGSSFEEGFRPVSHELQKLGEKVTEATRRIAESNSRVEALQTSVIRYLADRDERLERVRDESLLQLVDRMSDALKGRTKTKVADALREAEGRRKDTRDAARFRQSQEVVAQKQDARWPEDLLRPEEPAPDPTFWSGETKL